MNQRNKIQSFSNAKDHDMVEPTEQISEMEINQQEEVSSPKRKYVQTIRRKRRKIDGDDKLEVVCKAFISKATNEEIARELDVDKTQVQTWKNQMRMILPLLFSVRGNKERQKVVAKAMRSMEPVLIANQGVLGNTPLPKSIINNTPETPNKIVVNLSETNELKLIIGEQALEIRNLKIKLGI